MDITIETVLHAKFSDDGHQTFHGVVRVTNHATRKEESLDVIATVKLHRDVN